MPKHNKQNSRRTGWKINSSARNNWLVGNFGKRSIFVKEDRMKRFSFRSQIRIWWKWGIRRSFRERKPDQKSIRRSPLKIRILRWWRRSLFGIVHARGAIPGSGVSVKGSERSGRGGESQRGRGRGVGRELERERERDKREEWKRSSPLGTWNL